MMLVDAKMSRVRDDELRDESSWGSSPDSFQFVEPSLNLPNSTRYSSTCGLHHLVIVTCADRSVQIHTAPFILMNQIHGNPRLYPKPKFIYVCQVKRVHRAVQQIINYKIYKGLSNLMRRILALHIEFI